MLAGTGHWTFARTREVLEERERWEREARHEHRSLTKQLRLLRNLERVHKQFKATRNPRVAARLLKQFNRLNRMFAKLEAA